MLPNWGARRWDYRQRLRDKQNYYSNVANSNYAYAYGGSVHSTMSASAAPPRKVLGNLAAHAHVAGIAAGFLYYKLYLQQVCGLYTNTSATHAQDLAVTHSRDYLAGDWGRTKRDFDAEVARARRWLGIRDQGSYSYRNGYY